MSGFVKWASKMAANSFRKLKQVQGFALIILLCHKPAEVPFLKPAKRVIKEPFGGLIEQISEPRLSIDTVFILSQLYISNSAPIWH